MESLKAYALQCNYPYFFVRPTKWKKNFDLINAEKAYELGYEFTLDQLKNWNVKFDKLYFGKPRFDLLIDDKAFNYSSSWMSQI